MLHYRSMGDLSDLVRRNLGSIPDDVDLIVGIPRSGMLIATMIALGRNNKMCSLGEFVSNSPLSHGSTRQSRNSELIIPLNAKHILLVDDSIGTGKSIAAAEQAIRATDYAGKVTTLVGYATPSGVAKVGIALERIKYRFFEWNIFHREFLDQCLVDIDGVLCLDPTSAQNDDAEQYRDFLLTATPLMLPSHRVGALVTSRLEKWRPETEEWLKRHGVEYRELHMLDLPDAETRRAQGAHATFKASIYASTPSALLFIESEQHQALEIASITGKPVLCFTDQLIYRGGSAPVVLRNRARESSRLTVDRLLRRLRTARELGVVETARRIRKKFSA